MLHFKKHPLLFVAVMLSDNESFKLRYRFLLLMVSHQLLTIQLKIIPLWWGLVDANLNFFTMIMIVVLDQINKDEINQSINASAIFICLIF